MQLLQPCASLSIWNRDAVLSSGECRRVGVTQIPKISTKIMKTTTYYCYLLHITTFFLVRNTQGKLFNSSASIVYCDFLSAGFKQIEANPDTKRLYDDLLSNYNRLIRPVVNHTETLTVWLGLKLSQLIEMNLKNQVMTTNLWVVQVSKFIAIKC